MKTNHLLLAMTFASVLLLGTNLYAQQEVDPTWYDPWGAPSHVTSPSTPPHVAKSENDPSMVSALTKPRFEKLRASNSLVLHPGQSRPQPQRTSASEPIDLGMPSKGYLSSILVAGVSY
jgi:hypothetical protein